MFTGKIVLITGGTSGIGKAIGEEFALAGATVMVTGKTEREVVAFNESMSENELESRISAVVLDVQDQQAIERLTNELPTLDILVNCAGMILRENREFLPEEFATVLDVNLTGTMRVCSAFHHHLKESGGCIVNLASMLSFFGSKFAPAYASSKGGIAQLTKSLAIAWAEDGIRVNAVAPGWIQTALTESLWQDDARSQQLKNRTPLNRWGIPRDVAGPVLFLCSPAAEFITGVILPVDGGYSIA